MSELLGQSFEQIQSGINRALIDSGRKGEQVLILAVSKGQPVDRIIEAQRLGLSHFGENYVQEWKKKQQQIEDVGLGKSIHWHFIGHLQSNKVNQVVGQVDLIHSVDRKSLADAIDRIARSRGVRQGVLLEVNLAGEKSKAGVAANDLDELINHCLCLSGLELMGLMAMPPLDGENSSGYFKTLHEMLVKRADLIRSRGHSWSQLSMGTSHDYLDAVKAGATIIRLGTVLFGARKEKTL